MVDRMKEQGDDRGGMTSENTIMPSLETLQNALAKYHNRNPERIVELSARRDELELTAQFLEENPE